MNDWRSTFSGVNDHEGDWEQITLFLTEPDGGEKPELAFAVTNIRVAISGALVLTAFALFAVEPLGLSAAQMKPEFLSHSIVCDHKRPEQPPGCHRPGIRC